MRPVAKGIHGHFGGHREAPEFFLKAVQSTGFPCGGNSIFFVEHQLNDFCPASTSVSGRSRGTRPHDVISHNGTQCFQSNSGTLEEVVSEGSPQRGRVHFCALSAQ